MIKILKYHSGLKQQWNEFVRCCKNATFLFFRDYMDYHCDRYTDYSLMFYENDELLAVFPANYFQDNLISHGYLTYGGILCNEKMKTVRMLSIFDLLIENCRQKGIKEIVYKCIPHIYHLKPAEEDLYALFRHNAVLIRREISSCINIGTYKEPAHRRNGYNKALKSGVVISETDEFELFFEIANQTLNQKYGTKAVHTAEEMSMLRKRFPDNIKLYGAFKDNIMFGGAVIFLNKRTAHAQYLHFSLAGKKLRCLDLLILTLLKEDLSNFRYFDFGHSTENNGKYLNEPLINSKEEYGASAVCYDTYAIEI